MFQILLNIRNTAIYVNMFYDHYFGQKFTFCKESPLKLASKKPFYFTEINICEKDYFFGMEIV